MLVFNDLAMRIWGESPPIFMIRLIPLSGRLMRRAQITREAHGRRAEFTVGLIRGGLIYGGCHGGGVRLSVRKFPSRHAI